MAWVLDRPAFLHSLIELRKGGRSYGYTREADHKGGRFRGGGIHCDTRNNIGRVGRGYATDCTERAENLFCWDGSRVNDNRAANNPRNSVHFAWTLDSPVFLLTLVELRKRGEVLELVEGLLEHVLRVDVRHAEQVQHHVVGQAELRVQRIRDALKCYILVGLAPPCVP